MNQIAKISLNVKIVMRFYRYGSPFRMLFIRTLTNGLGVQITHTINQY